MNGKTFGVIIVIMLLGAFVWNWTSFEHIDETNAVEMCPQFHNVKCPRADFPFKKGEPIVKDGLGDEIVQYCGVRKFPTAVEWGCYHTSTNVIYLRDTKETDGLTLGHERCHWICGREHVKNQEYDIRDSFKLLD